MRDLIGRTLGHYRIVEKIGEGGMGEVYRAYDERLDRDIAIKVLPEEVASKPDRLARFEREARAVAKLNHANILDVFELGDHEGQPFMATELLEGETLRERLTGTALGWRQAAEIGAAIAQGLAAAHGAGIIHRDLKPSNIFITSDGRVKILDFGLAKLRERAQVAANDTITESVTTTPETTMGTVAYMSPEQARGEQVDEHSDFFSLGVVLYEMIAGERPFRAETAADTMAAILRDEPPRLSKVVTGISARFEGVVGRCLQKWPEERYASGVELAQALVRVQEELARPAAVDLRSLGRTIKKPRAAISAVILVCILVVFAVRTVQRTAEVRRIREHLIPEAMRLAAEEEYLSAFRLAREAENVIPDDPALQSLWPQITLEIPIQGEPPGVEFYVKDHDDIDSEWIHLGEASGEGMLLPRGYHRWRQEKEGFEGGEINAPAESLNWPYDLREVGTVPPKMVWAGGGKGQVWLNLGQYEHVEAVDVGEVFIDMYEVANDEYREFVESGGYTNPQYWNHDFAREGRTLAWNEAMAELVDETGRPGPATWAFGTYPEGMAEYPVTGVSWYEAAAYCDFRGKTLPTVYHWARFSGSWAAEYVIPFSNIEGAGLAPVGGWGSLTGCATYDMAGNAREWCFNASGDNRFILGGAWNDPAYEYTEARERPPFDRATENGFRCVEQISPGADADAIWRPLERIQPRDWTTMKPFSDEVFQTHLDSAAYRRVPLEEKVEVVDDRSPLWRMEKVSFTAATGPERMLAYLFLPKNVTPPYQAVVYFPGSSPMMLSSSRDGLNLCHRDYCDFFVRGGRAVIYPVYTATYERGGGSKEKPTPPEGWAARYVREVARSIDYLESRDDVDGERIAFAGFSWGAWRGVIILPHEDRIKASILIAGGLVDWDDQHRYALRVTTPVLLATGRNEMVFPYETSQLPLFRALATPAEHKRHLVLDAYHSPQNFQKKIIRESLAWLDKYLGPVE